MLIIFLALFAVKYYTSRSIQFKTKGTVFQIYKNGKWQDFLIKGVDIGAAIPGSFPGEMGISKKDYARWFKEITAMNANAIRVYTILGPEFYMAFFEYNMYNDRPLYLFHGVWNNEEAVMRYQNAYQSEISGEFKSEIADLIDVLHGNKTIPSRRGHASGAYIWDVSPWVAGYILGIEPDPEFVTGTNKNNPQVTGFNGSFLYTQNASPFECWQAEMGDYAIRYEHSKYKTERPVSWTNWISTDPLNHPYDPNRPSEDSVSVDIEHIKTKDSFQAGLFASYHIYPYYPEFMMYESPYTKFIDEKGKINPYEAYFRELHGYHTVPLLVAEFGVPSSRGLTHINTITGYNQGFITEKQAGADIADMYDSIAASGCAGGLIFSWQDEWTKKSWNTTDYDLPDRRAYWSNAQSSEQSFGILTFDPGRKKSVVYVDGDISEWKSVKTLTHTNGLGLSVQSDEKYVYLMIRDESLNPEENKYAIAVSGLKTQGNLSYAKEGLAFHNPASQCIIINGKDNSAIYVDAYYDIFYRQYSLLENYNVVKRNMAFEAKNSGIFNPIFLLLRQTLNFPLSRTSLPPSYYETGKLLHGNANPDSTEYNSLADFFINPQNRSIELRIPWQLLNAADPSTKTVIGDLYAHDEFNINPVTIKGFTFELYRISGSGITEGGAGFYSWKPWETVNYHERLKQSYPIIKDTFAKY